MFRGSHAVDHNIQINEIRRNLRREDGAPPAPTVPSPSVDVNNNDDPPALALSPRIRHEHRGRLMYYLDSRTVSDKDVWVLNLAELQRLNLQVLRNKLAAIAVVDLGLEVNNPLREKDAKGLEQVMHAYCEALRDWDYMQQQREDDEFITDPFKMVSSQGRDHYIMEGTGLMQKYPTRWGERLTRRQMIPDDSGIPELPGYSRARFRKTRQLREVTERLWYGIIGGLALIIPMLVMVLHNTLLTSLLTVSVATLLFAGFCAMNLEVESTQLMAATATYAAVLVVFVGTTTSLAK